MEGILLARDDGEIESEQGSAEDDELLGGWSRASRTCCDVAGDTLEKAGEHLADESCRTRRSEDAQTDQTNGEQHW